MRVCIFDAYTSDYATIGGEEYCPAPELTRILRQHAVKTQEFDRQDEQDEQDGLPTKNRPHQGVKIRIRLAQNAPAPWQYQRDRAKLWVTVLADGLSDWGGSNGFRPSFADGRKSKPGQT